MNDCSDEKGVFEPGISISRNLSDQPFSACHQDNDQQKNANQASIEIDIQIAIMRIGYAGLHRRFNCFAARASPKIPKPRTNQRIYGAEGNVLPNIRSSSKRGVAAQHGEYRREHRLARQSDHWIKQRRYQSKSADALRVKPTTSHNKSESNDQSYQRRPALR